MDPTITCWNGTSRVGPVGGLLDLTGTATANGPGSAQFLLRSDNRRIEALSQPDARATVDWPTRDGTARLVSGRVTAVKGASQDKSPVRMFTITDFWSDEWDNIVYPNPDGTDAQQGDESAYYVSSGPLETVILDLLAQSVKKSGNTLVIPTSQGRGDTVSVSMRCHKLSDRLLPYVQGSGLVVRIVLDDSDGKPHVVITEPSTLDGTLTAKSGVVTDKGWDNVAPAWNTVVVMAGGEGTARKMKTYTDTAAVTASGGTVLQHTVDARDIALGDPNLESLMQQRATEALAEGAAKVSLDMTLTETGWFRLGSAYDLGTPMTVKPQDGPELTDSVRQIRFSIQGGPKVQPYVGEWSDDSTDKTLISLVTRNDRRLTELERNV